MASVTSMTEGRPSILLITKEFRIFIDQTRAHRIFSFNIRFIICQQSSHSFYIPNPTDSEEARFALADNSEPFEITRIQSHLLNLSHTDT
jgi:hypothetical protein